MVKLPPMLLPLAIIVLLTTILCETAARKGWLPYWISRKVLHVIAVGACAVAVVEIERGLFIWIVVVTELALIGLIASNQLLREESGRRAWGIVWFPLALLILLLGVQDDHLVAFCMLILAVCDPAATVAGKLWAQDTYQLTGDAKSLVGNGAFFTSFLMITYFFPPAREVWGADAGMSITELYPLPWLIFVGLLLTAGEALGSRGLDNLTVPLLAGLFLSVNSGYEGHLQVLTPAILASVPFCYLMVRRRSLSPGGAITATILGLIVITFAGPAWLMPLFLFLLSSSLIGKLFPVKSAAGDAKQKQPRDATQVLANGVVYGLLTALHWPNDNLTYLMPPTEVLVLTAMAIATADTWSSEIGQYFRQPTYDLVKWRKVPTGLSGGVSVAGTLAGLGGSAFIVGTCFWLVPYVETSLAIKIVLAGFLGMLLDSVLGSLFQAKYRDVNTGALSDTSGRDKKLVGGFRWMTNDLVNFLAILLGVWGFDVLLMLL